MVFARSTNTLFHNQNKQSRQPTASYSVVLRQRPRERSFTKLSPCEFSNFALSSEFRQYTDSMYSKNLLAAGALLSVAAAVPLVKRDLVWVTKTDEAIVTIPVTKTVWVTPGEIIPTDSAGSGHYGHRRPTSTLTVQSTYTAPASPVAPAASSYEAPFAPASTSVYVAPSSTSVYVAPTTSTSVYVAPAPTSTTSAAAAASTSAASSSSGSGSGVTGAAAPGTSYTGDFTWYQVGMGACGVTSTPSQHIVAISHVIYDMYTPNGNPNNNPLCGTTVNLIGKDGSTYPATIVDRCVGCAESDLDLSEDFFNLVTENGNGRVSNMKWSFA